MFDRGVFHCDECSEFIDTEEKEFAAALEVAKAAGWRSFKGPDKKWAQACPACVEQFATDRKSRR